MVKFHSAGVERSSVTLMSPEANPPARGVHGLAKVDWVTEWSPGKPVNWNWMMSPLVALMLLGENFRAGAPGWPPTVTGITVWAETTAVVARAAKTDAKSIIF